MAKQTHRHVSIDKKEMFINMTIEDDLRFFKANYNAKQAELFEIRKQIRRNAVNMDRKKKLKLED
jgi:hypothetical protein